ncbi:MAG: hypothetical protein NWE94_07890 [Candidatus Bathyarchaeota archaeon]|nr:hypothetical protein [Candidatus Bathyarchaeota archaeon]
MKATMFRVGLVLALILPLVIMQTPLGVSAELTNQEKAVGFLANVVGLDLSQYEVELKYYNDYSSYSNRLADADATYKLISEGSQLTAKFFFKDDAKFICSILDLKGPLLLTQSAIDVLASAKGFMERYQIFTGASYLQPLREMLQNVTELKNTTLTVGDLRLKVEPSPVGEDFVTFQWMHTPNGIHNRFTRITLMFNKGMLEQFSDNWNSCVVGTSDVNVSEEQAISIAKEHVAAYSYTFGNRTIGNLTINKDLQPLASLSMQIKKDNLLYPCWELLVPLAKVYPGFVTGIHLYLWADSGELALIEKSGGGGAISESPITSNDSPINGEDTEAAQPNKVDNQASSIAAIVIALVAIPLAIAAIRAITKRRSKKEHSLLFFCKRPYTCRRKSLKNTQP